MKIPFLGGWTSINPSYFDVNRRGTRFWHTAIFSMAMTQEPIKIGDTYCTIYVWPIFQGYVRGYTPNSYGLKNGTNVPPFWDPGIPIDFLQEKTCCKTKPDVRVRPALFLRGQICHPLWTTSWMGYAYVQSCKYTYLYMFSYIDIWNYATFPQLLG